MVRLLAQKSNRWLPCCNRSRRCKLESFLTNLWCWMSKVQPIYPSERPLYWIKHRIVILRSWVKEETLLISLSWCSHNRWNKDNSNKRSPKGRANKRSSRSRSRLRRSYRTREMLQSKTLSWSILRYLASKVSTRQKRAFKTLKRCRILQRS